MPESLSTPTSPPTTTTSTCEAMWNNTKHAKKNGFTASPYYEILWKVEPSVLQKKDVYCTYPSEWFLLFCCPRPRLLVIGSIQSTVFAITFLDSVGNKFASCVLPLLIRAIMFVIAATWLWSSSISWNRIAILTATQFCCPHGWRVRWRFFGGVEFTLFPLTDVSQTSTQVLTIIKEWLQHCTVCVHVYIVREATLIESMF